MKPQKESVWTREVIHSYVQEKVGTLAFGLFTVYLGNIPSNPPGHFSIGIQHISWW